MNELFLENTKKHNMETRKNDKYVVNFAHKERLKNSSVISMQNYLNNEEKQCWTPVPGEL